MSLVTAGIIEPPQTSFAPNLTADPNGPPLDTPKKVADHMIDAALALEHSVNALKEIAELGKLYDHPAAALQAAQAAMTAQRVANTITGQGWKFMSCSHCQELG